MDGWLGGWVGGRNFIIKTISAELDCAELGKMQTSRLNTPTGRNGLVSKQCSNSEVHI